MARLSKVLDMSNVAIITGAGSGFGLGLTKKLLGEDWIVYGADISPDGLALLKSIGAHPLKVNVTSDSQVAAGVKKVIKEQGRIDVLVANAGYGTFSSVEETTSEQVRAIFDVNVFGIERFVKGSAAANAKTGFWPHHRNNFRCCSRFTCWTWLVFRNQARSKSYDQRTSPRGASLRDPSING